MSDFHGRRLRERPSGRESAMSEQTPPATPGSFDYLRSIAGERFNPTTMLAALLVLAVLYTLYFARDFLR